VSAPARFFKRGAVVMVNLEPVAGSEQGGVRPVLILSSLEKIRASRARPMYIIVPLTRSQTLTGPLAPRITARAGGMPLDSTALVMHMRSIDPARIRSQAGILNADELERVTIGVRVMLELD
jgi:mRNA interferase MazF